ncbi:MAG: hypothetical protein U5J82_11795 [Desulfobacterales bacterium]|nr:hypothetical protein [Desulfobacterales bacterium]
MVLDLIPPALTPDHVLSSSLPLHTAFSAFNVFRYITFRTIYASLTAFFICFILGPWVIRRLTVMQVGQYIRDDGPPDPPAKGRHAHHGGP